MPSCQTKDRRSKTLMRESLHTVIDAQILQIADVRTVLIIPLQQNLLYRERQVSLILNYIFEHCRHPVPCMPAGHHEVAAQVLLLPTQRRQR
jgi:hypothetical protein